MTDSIIVNEVAITSILVSTGEQGPPGPPGTDTPVNLTGDITGYGISDIETTLISTGVTAGTYGYHAGTPAIVIDSKGRVIQAQTIPIAISADAIDSGILTATRLPAFSGDISTTEGSSVTTLKNSGVTVGTYTKVTVDSKGIVTTGSTPTTIADIGITNVYTKTETDNALTYAVSSLVTFSNIQGKPTTQAGYGITDVVNTSALGVTIPTLVNSVIPSQFLPSYVDDVLEFTTLTAFPTTGETGKIYVDLSNNFTYRWSGTIYVEVGGRSTTDAGLLTSGTLPSARLPALSGDVTLVQGSSTLNLSNTGVTANTYGSVSKTVTITVDSKGRITSASQADISIPSTSVSGLVSSATTDTTNAANISSGTLPTGRLPAFTGDVTSLVNTATLTLTNSGVTAGIVNNSSTAVTPLTIDAKGRVTATGTNVTITPSFYSLTNLPTTLSGYGISNAYTKTEVDNAITSSGIGNTDNLVEGTSNLYFTALRAQNAVTSVIGNAGTASKLLTPRNISITGDISCSITSFDGSTNLTAISTLTTSGATAGTYKSVTVDAKGRVTAGTNPTTLNDYGITDAVASSLLGANSGVAQLDSSGKVPATQLPSYVDDVLEYANLASLPSTGETGKIYIAQDTNKIYRWSGSAYIEISPTVGNADTATKLATARTINGVSFDGSTNITIADSTKEPTITAGTSSQFWKGNKTWATLIASDIPNLDWSKITTGKPTTLAGYGITDGGYTLPIATSSILGGVKVDGTSVRIAGDGTISAGKVLNGGTASSTYL